jgi:type III secretion protein R
MLAVATSGLELGANPINTVIVLGMLSLLPFMLMMTTSFLKFAVVLSILRNALGTQQIPPNPVVMGLAVMLTVYVMSPVGAQIYSDLEADLKRDAQDETLSGQGAVTILNTIEKSKPPMREFLKRHAHAREVEMFHQWAKRMGPEDWKRELAADDLVVLIPAFSVSELTEAFAIGFLLFLPFLVIDMVVSNILLAMGMHMLSPVVVSLPFKLLLFVMADGWALLTRGLLQGYLT